MTAVSSGHLCEKTLDEKNISHRANISISADGGRGPNQLLKYHSFSFFSMLAGDPMAISYTFQDTRIHLFDINIVPDLLHDPTRTIKNPEYQILADESSYDNFQSSENYLRSPNFIGTRYPTKHRRASTLWRRYTKDYPDEPASSWAAQVPLYMRLRKHNLELDALPEEDRLHASADSYVTLNALGWSTHINIRLRHSLRPSQLVDLCANLRGATYGVEPYRLNGEKMSSRGLFKYYRNRLTDDILSHGSQINTPVSNLIFVDVFQAEGEPIPYSDYPLPLIKLFAKTIDGKNHSVVKVSHRGELVYMIRDMWVAFIDRDHYNFSICDFKRGVFTFLQREALQGDKPGGTRCYANNTRDSFLLGYFWSEYFRQMNDEAAKNVIVQQLLKKGATAISQLKKNYTSRTSLSFLQRYGPLQSFLPQEEVSGHEVDGVEGDEFPF